MRECDVSKTSEIGPRHAFANADSVESHASFEYRHAVVSAAEACIVARKTNLRVRDVSNL